MAFPKPVPTLTREQYQEFRKRLEAFEVSDDVEQDIQKHMELLEEEDG